MKISFEELPHLPNIDLLAKKLVEGFITGLHKSPFHGFSVEFAEHRLYNTGESTKHIDWKVFARTDKLFTKQYDEETNLRAYIMVDNSSSMYYPSENKGKIKYAVLAAACLSYLLQKQRDAVGLISFSDKIDLFTEVKSTQSHLRNLFTHFQHLLEQESSQKTTALADTIHTVAEKIHKRSLVIIFSDLLTANNELDEFFQAIQHLKHKKHEVLFFQINDQQTELDLGLEDRPYLIEDLESGNQMKLNPSDVKDWYKEKSEAYFKEIELKCQQYKIDLTKIDINENIEKALASFLIKRSKMR
ncbi:DUF58 domain-containing protein [Marivirga atlantica]|jgi:uncharacterized protein (DUF58 family)|uniref:DUF58 domain-containing protein n=1 Tax=Marivirga atlantica TaxID=1548457 RepID=A0A937DGI5_9BACT|nr:DUF58 domain-containing protein [Marivirga atlantica]MBL0764823.1 DUF58 domain-containing protein [Marivirga atlantica]